jgi:hypothetical protein
MTITKLKPEKAKKKFNQVKMFHQKKTVKSFFPMKMILFEEKKLFKKKTVLGNIQSVKKQ